MFDWFLLVLAILSIEILVSATPPTFSQGILMKVSSYCFHDLKMIIFYLGHARLIFTRVMVLWLFLNSKSCLCNSCCSFQWILMIPFSYCSHDLKRIILYRGSLECFVQELWPFSIITIGKPCQHNILRTA